jgi:ankyrin repeat protein
MTEAQALCDAANNGDVPRIKALIASGVDVNQHHDGWTPLHLATIRGHLAVVKALIAAGADVNARDTGGGTTVLHFAALHGRRKIATALIAAGADVNELSNGSSPARRALIYGHRSMLKLLLRAGAAMIFNAVSRHPYREAAYALFESVNAAGGWDEFVVKHRAIIKSIISKCAPLPDDCLLTIAAFVCPPGGW